MKKKVEEVLKIVVILNALLLLAILVSGYIKVPRLTAQKTQPTNQEYELTPIRPDKIFVEYPYVWVALKDKNYIPVFYLEKLRLLTGEYNNLQLAKKRISELLLWGSETDIANIKIDSANPDRTLQRLQEFWRNKQLNFVKRDFSGFNIWESELARYAEFYIDYLGDTSDNSDIETVLQKKLTVHKELLRDRALLLHYIENIDIPTDDKKYLIDLTKSTYDALLKKADIQSTEDNKLNSYYVLNTVRSSERAGIYDIYVENTNLPDTPISIIVGDKKYYPVNNVAKKTYVLQFRNIPIASNNTFISLVTDKNNPIPLTQWTPYITNTASSYEYTYRIPKQYQTLDQFVTFHYDSTHSAYFHGDKTTDIMSDYTNTLVKNDNQVLSTVFAPEDRLVGYQTPVSTQQEFMRELKMKILFPYALDPVALSTNYMTVTPIYDPPITLVKKGQPPVSGNVNTHGQRPDFFYVFMLMASLCASLLALFLVRSRRLLQVVVTFLSKIIPVLLFMFVALLITDLFFLKSGVDFILFPTLVIWMLITAITSLSDSVDFSMAFAMLVLALDFKLVKLDAIGEKFAVWAYIFLVYGMIHKAILFRAERERLPPSEFFQKYACRSYHVYIKVRSFLKWCIRRVAHIVSFQAKKKSDHAKNALSTLFIVILVYLLYLGINKLIVQQTIIAQDPVIKKLEPHIAYYSTKVVIKGNKFGLKSDKNARIISTYGPIKATEWSSGRIVFQIPPSIPTETIKVWIEKSITINNKKETISSNKIKINVIPTTNGLDDKDDQFVKQFQNIDPDTIKLNGF